MIKDSGSRRLFTTGAVRDMQEGKGRCDLMPLEVLSKFVDSKKEKDYVLHEIARFMKTLKTTYLYGALREFSEDAYQGDKETMLLEVAKHFEEGAKKYGPNNWQKGLPISCYIDSAVRHYLKYKRGDKDEPHDRAFTWNILCCIWEVDYHVGNQ